VYLTTYIPAANRRQKTLKEAVEFAKENNIIHCYDNATPKSLPTAIKRQHPVSDGAWISYRDQFALKDFQHDG
jgi:hypothetical protein